MGVKRAAAFRGGSGPLVQAARLRVVSLTLAKHAPIFIFLLAPPALWAVIEGQMALSLSLALPAVLCLGLFGIVWRLPLPDDLRGIEALVSIALVFGLSALLAVPAFMSLGMPPLDALFEAVSAATTTGLSVAAAPDAWPFAGHFLRAWVQWCGGLVMATAVLALLLPSGLPARKLGQAGIDQGDRIASTRRQAQQLLGVYVGLTALMAGLAALAIPDTREAVVLTLSAISTAGFAPRSDSLASYSALGQGIVMLTCVFGAISLLTFILILQRKPKEAWAIGSARRVLLAILGFGAVYATMLYLGGMRSWASVYPEMLNLISGLTTAGFSTGAMPPPGAALLVIVIAMLAGGDVGSTAGGLKLARLGIVARAVLHAAQRPRLPANALAPLRHHGEPVEDRTLVSILALIGIYLAVLVVLWMHMLGHGHPAMPALFEVVSTLSTVGLSTGIVGPDLSDDLKLSLTFGMWLGRLEFFAVLLLLAPRTWMKGR
ncbi:Potassium uptake protein TrkH [Roseibacterium elongatum DSM 19469]|uniref:Potassium uptake protein TrkH n=2 Tax=Roseicyclus elongatus TaxID=159346 RepID=W8RV26_9RHOB|nr:Potassium uptake protein TrkH [Roseibacterium elongatum DSM 19469]